MKHPFLALSLSVGVLGLTSVPAAKASEWDRRTVVTFRAPVEIPNPSVRDGSMVLAPGTYVMKLVDLAADRNVVQFFDKKETHIYSTALAIPDYRTEAPDKTIITFEERAAGAPQAIKEWFYPGDNTGEEFVYPKAAKLALAAESSNLTERPAPAPAPVAEARPEPKPEVSAAPAPPKPQPVEIAQAAPAPAQVKPAEPAKPAEPKKELPKTASDLPLIALLGALSLSAGTLLRASRAR